MSDDQQEIDLSRRIMTAAGYAKRAASIPVGAVTIPLSMAGSIAIFVLSGLVCFPVALSRGWNPCARTSHEDREATSWARSYQWRHSIENRPVEYAGLPLFLGF